MVYLLNETKHQPHVRVRVRFVFGLVCGFASGMCPGLCVGYLGSCRVHVCLFVLNSINILRRYIEEA